MKTHWRKFINDTYVNESNFFDDNGNEITIVAEIVKIEKTKVTNPAGKTEEMPVLYFKECKPLILSAKKNFKLIVSALKSSFVQDWIGQKIELWYNPEVMWGREKVGGVRVKPVAPKINKPVLTEEHAHFQSIREAIASGARTIEQIKRKFELTDSIITKLTETDAK